ncbi:hypothetical protein RD792_008483 [Penstemon davidsonii]|uniref:Folate-biopterin transporter 2 n=1 Tax=Penstemon davidsonii TaxID=160366 RepID=A0ABR0D988_9LAMI|nr:hypothetical protein RD792_008483 [Penstemon davidsonii]
MGEEETLPTHKNEIQENKEQPSNETRSCLCTPIDWCKMLVRELDWSFVLVVMIVYGISQGLGGALARVGTEYYMKDVQKVQPSEAQVYSGITSIPWILKPLWGLLTDVVPILGYHRRPYFVLAGSASVAIGDVTVDACVAQKSGNHPSLASDMQTLCSLSFSIGSLIGFSLSGIFVHLIGPQGVYGLLTIPAGLVLLVGTLLKEPRSSIFAYEQETIGYIMAIGSVGSLIGTILYQYKLKNYPFRDLLFWAQVLSCLSGMLDLVLVLRLNLKLNIPDHFFVLIDTSVTQMVARFKWMPLLVLSSKLCPAGIEGTFFALLMSIDNAGVLTSSWLGGLLLHSLNVTRTEFDKLWLAVFIRNISRITPLFLLFLVPRSDSNSSVLENDVLNWKGVNETSVSDNVELVALVHNTDDR